MIDYLHWPLTWCAAKCPLSPPLVANHQPWRLAAKAATTIIPIVFSIGGDPIRVGLVSNLNRPGGNITGVSFFQSDIGAKRDSGCKPTP